MKLNQLRSGNAVFAISGGSAVYASNASNASRSNFREFDNLDHHRSAFKIIILVNIAT